MEKSWVIIGITMSAILCSPEGWDKPINLHKTTMSNMIIWTEGDIPLVCSSNLLRLVQPEEGCI